jgi:hypothetical protein
MRLIGICISLLFITSCTSNTEKLDQLNWLHGTWVRTFNGVTQIEKWEKKGNNLIGQSIYVQNSDSTLMSKYTLMIKNNAIIYTSNEIGFEDSTTYDLKYFSSDSIVFQTTQSVWPQSILLFHTPKNTFIRSLSGQQQQMKNFVHFEFQKIK